MLLKINFSILFIIAFGNAVMGSRILAIFPYPSYSHEVVHNLLTQALADRGHELVVFTTFPLNKNISNYREISLKFLQKAYKKKFNFMEINKKGIWYFLKTIKEFGVDITDIIYSHPEMKRIISSKKSSDKFDLIILSALCWDSLYYLSDLLDAPMIGMTTLPDLVSLYPFGSPLYASYVPNVFSRYDENMNFFQRIHNTYYTLRGLYDFYYNNMPAQEKVLIKHFGNNYPPVRELAQRVSMLFINRHPFFHPSRPIAPHILQIGGIRSTKMNLTLPSELKTLLDKFTDGFIYFSLGSNIQSDSINNNTLHAIIQAFSELPYQIIWKFESEHLNGKPDNVHIKKWLPQTGILSHPNIKLFLYQGGLQSTEEAIDTGVPMLGLPIFSDQWYNLGLLKKHGVAQFLDFNNIDKNQIKNAIIEIISNSSYRDNIQKVKQLWHDRPMCPVNEAIWWTEHVIRHKGAKHLHPHGLKMSFLILEQIDIIAFFTIIFIVLLLLGWISLRAAFAMIQNKNLIYSGKTVDPSTMKKKTK